MWLVFAIQLILLMKFDIMISVIFFAPYIQSIYNQLMSDKKRKYYSNCYHHIKNFLILLNRGNLNNLVISKKILFSRYNFNLELIEFFLFILLHVKPAFYSISIEIDFYYINDQ